MILKNNYIYFKDALSKKFCNDVIKHGSNQNFSLGEIAESNSIDKEKIKKIRDSFVSWLTDWWIYRPIYFYFNEANSQAKWNFQWESCEQIQFTKYKKNQHYTWHRDGWENTYDESNSKDKNLFGKIRKLSMVCQLSDPSDYKGGELEFSFPTPENRNISSIKEIITQGSIVVFPSFIWHRVKPVTEGTRYSLVIWSIGNNFI